MHVGMLIDGVRLQREHAMLNRVAVGLMGEAVRVTRLLPNDIMSDTVLEAEKRMALAGRYELPMRVVSWLRAARAAAVSAHFERTPLDLIYAIGTDAWSTGLDLGARMDLPVALEVWTARQFRNLPRGRARDQVGAYVAVTFPIGEALKQHVDPHLVSVAPMGISIPKQPRTVLPHDDRPALVSILGRGRDIAAYRSMLIGLSKVMVDEPNIQLALELAGPHDQDIWRHAQHLNLLERMSGIDEATHFRPLIMESDLVLIPERYGDLRSIILEVMAHGIPVIASADPMLDILTDSTAVLIPDPDSDLWAGAVRRLIHDPEVARSIGVAGRRHVQAYHGTSGHVEKLLATFTQMLVGPTIQFAEVQR